MIHLVGVFDNPFVVVFDNVLVDQIFDFVVIDLVIDLDVDVDFDID
jgi:hypothetical protein